MVGLSACAFALLGFCATRNTDELCGGGMLARHKLASQLIGNRCQWEGVSVSKVAFYLRFRPHQSRYQVHLLEHTKVTDIELKNIRRFVSSIKKIRDRIHHSKQDLLLD